LATLVAAAIAVMAFAGVDAIRSAPIPVDRPPSPAPGGLRANGEVLNFTGHRSAPGDLVAVNPETREERVIAENLDVVYSAAWSADGRWIAYETSATEGRAGLWVVSASQESRQVATGGVPGLMAGYGLDWMWSPSGAELATLDGATLHTIDPVTGEMTDFGTIDDAPSLGFSISAWSWSPDGRITFVATREGIASVDVRSGERSLLARLPGENLDAINEIAWSPDGARVAVVSSSMSNSTGRLYVMDADGSDVRVLVDGLDARGVVWSPDGARLAFVDWSEPDRNVRIWVAQMDGSAPAQIGRLAASCRFPYKCDLTWSPDGARLAFATVTGVPEPGQGDEVLSVINADGTGDAGSINELTYRSWDGGAF
ncbi:MAG: SMP-30/gluconolactonase/LRE family protein, partial [Actinomycetota bacterium]|nr:SMP-30/gluconolactonase/LRE family protein [Actinomycetota bacterium]